MAAPSQFVKHIESYVDSSTSPTQQAACVDAIATLLKNDALSFESLVREMDLYLTTTDSTIRARGILFLAELLTCLASKPLDNATIHSLIQFFIERLADWRALRGALVGCLALMRRKNNVGVISGKEAASLLKSFLHNLQVQSLGQHDRKLCFELLRCILDSYADAIIPLGDTLVGGICGAIDGEKDPHCLIIAFHIVTTLATLFPDPSGPLASFSTDLFDILGCYFPIHFTHPKEDVFIEREELSQSLMVAFACAPLFEPFAIPLLLEKLSSTLASTKIESLKYLSYCSAKYGAERMANYMEALWCSIRDAIYTSLIAVPLESELQDSTKFQENEIAVQALVLLQDLVTQNENVFLSFVLHDEDIKGIMQIITSFKRDEEISMQSKQRLHGTGCILSVLVKASVSCCNKVFELFFPQLMSALSASVQDSLDDSHSDVSNDCSFVFNFGALYLLVELLSACRYLVICSGDLIQSDGFSHEPWCCLLHHHCSTLTKALTCILVTCEHKNQQDAHVQAAAKGLQILATFPKSFLSIPKSIYESLLLKFTSILTTDFSKTMLWKLALKSLVEIGSFAYRHQDTEKASKFEEIVVESVASLLSSDAASVFSSLKLEAVTNIGMTCPKFMLKIVQGLEKIISAKFSEAYVHWNSDVAGFTILLLDCYTKKMLPWFNNIGGFEEVPLHFAINLWNLIESSRPSIFLEQKLLEATMMSMKVSVACCSVEIQKIIAQRSFEVLSSKTLFLSKDSVSGIIQTGLDVHNSNISSFKDEWIISLFASVIVALRPQTDFTNVKAIIQLFTSMFLNGHVPSAQALGSLVNKLPLQIDAQGVSNFCSSDEAVDVVFAICTRKAREIGTRSCVKSDANKKSLSSLRIHDTCCGALQINAIIGLAWIGKGLLMRGHERVKDIIMTFLSFLLNKNDDDVLLSKCNWSKDEQELLCTKAAADAFNILLSDSEVCLNKEFHATTRILYKQRFFNTMMPILQASLSKSDSSLTRSMLYRASAHVISNAPLIALLSEASKLIPLLLDGLSYLRDDILNKEIIYNLLLIFSGMLTEETGKVAAVENTHDIITRLIELISYPHMMLVRETAIQCLITVSDMPYSKIYPMRNQVLNAIKKALDDPKRSVRQEAVRCRQVWTSTAS